MRDASTTTTTHNLINDATATTARLKWRMRAHVYRSRKLRRIALCKTQRPTMLQMPRNRRVSLLAAASSSSVSSSSPTPLPSTPSPQHAAFSTARGTRSLLLSVFSSPYSSPFLGRWPPLSESAFANYHPHNLRAPA